MKRTVRATLLCAVSFVATLTVFSQTRRVPAVRIEGSYENLTVSGKSGDLEGMRVILIDGGGWIHAIVQRAQGGAEPPDPMLTRVTVKGTEIRFSVKFPGEDHVETFLGKVSAAGLRLRRGDPLRPSFLGTLPGEQPFFLTRKKC
jgi:hypothetical protein